MDSINPNFKRFKKHELPTANDLFNQLVKGNRAALSRALTFVESKNSDHRKLAEELINMALPISGRSIRIGITGVPGVGKALLLKPLGNT